MIESKVVPLIAAMVFAVALGLRPLPVAAETPTQTFAVAENGDAESQAPRSPIKVKTIDFEDAGEKAGKLTVAGTATPGSDLYLYFDDVPLAKIIPNGEGEWSLEQELELNGGRHTLRAEQYDPATRLLAGRAMITIERAPDAGSGQSGAGEP